MSNNTKNQEVKQQYIIYQKNLFNQKDLFKFIKDNKND
jgi:hypothetical protein